MAIFLFWLFCAVISCLIARSKARSGLGWFLLGMLIGPFAFIVAALPNLKEEQAVAQGVLRKCPFCAELIKQEAVKCRFCGSEVPPVTYPDGMIPTGICGKCGHLFYETFGDEGWWCPKCKHTNYSKNTPIESPIIPSTDQTLITGKLKFVLILILAFAFLTGAIMLARI